MPAPSPRIALIHATPLSVAPVAAAFERHWPQARCMNLLDDSLSVDRARAGRLDDAMVQRFVDLAQYAVRAGASGILYSCSAFGPAIEAAARVSGVPTLKPNEAMFEQALSHGARLGLVATFEASVASMAQELREMAAQRGVAVDLRSVFVPGAMDDLREGRTAEHHRKVAEAVRTLAHCDAVMLAQFSMAAAATAAQQQVSCPVLTSPDCAVLALLRRMAPGWLAALSA